MLRAQGLSRALRTAVTGLPALLLAALLVVMSLGLGESDAAALAPKATTATTASVTQVTATPTTATTRPADQAATAVVGTSPLVELVLAPETPVFDPAADTLRFSILVRNAGEEPLPAGILRLWLDDQQISSETELGAFEIASAEAAEHSDPLGIALDDTHPAMSHRLLTSRAIESLSSGDERGLTLSVPRAEMPLLDTDEGVFGLRADLRETVGAGQASTYFAPTIAAATTAIVWQGLAAGHEVPVTAVIPLVLPTTVLTMPTRTELVEAIPRFDELLTQAEQWQATLAIDPRIFVGIRAEGTDAPGALLDFLTRLETTTAPMFLLQFADADPAAQAALEFETLLEPNGFSYLTHSADGGSEHTGSDGGEAAEFEPSFDDLLDWPATLQAAWPADGQVSTAALDLIRNAGITSVVLRSDNVVGDTNGRATVDGFDALIASSRAQDASALALQGASPTERYAGIAALVSTLALSAITAPDDNTASDAPNAAAALAAAPKQGVVLALERSAVADAQAPHSLLATLADLEWVRPLAADSQYTGAAQLRSAGPNHARITMIDEMMSNSVGINALAPLLTHPNFLTEYQRTRVLAALGTRWAGPDVEIAPIAEAIRARDHELLSGVEIVVSENTQLVGTASRVPILIRNSLPFEASVTLQIAPTSAAIGVPERTFADETVAPGGNTTVLVPVNSRVSSGDSRLIIKVTAVTGDEVFVERELRLTIRSSYETVMLTTLGVLAALLFAFGIWRSVRRHRKPVSTSADPAREQPPTNAADTAEPHAASRPMSRPD